MGFANLLADGISMGIGDFLSSQAELEYAHLERNHGKCLVENNLEKEKVF
jgi:vacuolar iron transporter family protein